MLINMKEILKLAEEKGNAIGAFDTPNLESIMAVLKAAEETDRPVIIMHAQCHENLAPIDYIGPTMLALAKRAKVPVCVHLDHGEDLDYVKRALDLGFTSVMYDGSLKPFAENAAGTLAAVKMAHAVGASVEAELGALGKRELGAGHEGEVKDNPTATFTKADDAAEFIAETGADALAVSFGTVHGIYLKKPCLDFSVLDNVRKAINVPMVMHGGSGISPEDFKTAITKGIRKVNYYTYMAKAAGEAVVNAVHASEGKVVYFHDLALLAENATRQNVKEAMEMFSLGR